MKQNFLTLLILLAGISGHLQQTAVLNQQEKDAILYMREEEKLARDIYSLLFEKWDVNPFGNIRFSEQVHMDKMKTLITNYGLEDPVEKNNDRRGVFTNTILQKYYTELADAGDSSLTQALKVGAKIEELDIKDLDERIKQTQSKDIISVYTYLRMASENHLRAFTRRLKMQGINYEPVILNKTEFDKIIQSGNKRAGKAGMN